MDFIIRKRVAIPATTHTGNSSAETCEATTPFSHVHGEYLLSLSICMKTHASLCSYVVSIIWYHSRAHPSLLIQQHVYICLLALHDVFLREHTIISLLYYYIGVKKLLKTHQWVTLGDIFLDYHEHTCTVIYFVSIPQDSVCGTVQGMYNNPPLKIYPNKCTIFSKLQWAVVFKNG